MLDRKSGILIWFILVRLTTFKGCFSTNATEKVTEESHQTENTTLVSLVTETTTEFPSILNPVSVNWTSFNQTVWELGKNGTIPIELFNTNETIIIQKCMEMNSMNLTCLQGELNGTLGTDYLNVAETIRPEDGFLAFGLQNTAAIAAGVFLVSAVVGYLSCVGYRQFLQRKYGNSQVLIAEEVYDTSDLRYFEI